MAPPTEINRLAPAGSRRGRLAALAALAATTFWAGCPEPPAPPPKAAAAVDLAAAAPEPAVKRVEDEEPAAHSSELGLLHQPLPRLPAEGAVYAVADFPQHTPPLHEGTTDDRRLVEVYCVGCHSTTYISMQPPLPRERWEAEVKKMISPFGAMLPDNVAVRIATYLHSYYGDSPLPPRKHPPTQNTGPAAPAPPSPGSPGH